MASRLTATTSFWGYFFNSCNRPFPSSQVPLFQNESICETFHMKMSSACSFIFMQIKVIFIRMVSHLDSLWNGGTRELGNGLFLRQRPSFSAHRAAPMTKTDLIFPAYSSKFVDFAVQFCFRCKFSFHGEWRSSQVWQWRDFPRPITILCYA